MTDKPHVKVYEDGTKMWQHTFDLFKAKVFVPTTELRDDVINYGLAAPYLLVFEENEMDEASAKSFAQSSGLFGIASRYATSVVFISPTCEGGWKDCDEELFKDLIANSKIHQYHEDGYAILHNRLKKTFEGYAIRGAIYRTFLFGKGESADFIAKHLIKEITGEGLWGSADIVPTACILENLSVKPVITRRDMPIVSIGNSQEINDFIMDSVDDCYIQSNALSPWLTDYTEIFDEFLRHYKRWGWVGTLEDEPDFEEMGMVKEPGIVNLKTSADNDGDDRGTDRHDVGYLAYYNKTVFDNGPAPLLLAFHGGGDSAMYIAEVSEWYKVAHDHDFLLVCVEDHINSTATEMMELLERLYERYDIDKKRVYASGFSMGGCKSWDLYQEYPHVFAGIAPMDATFDVGFNVYGNKVERPINKDVRVPIFYTGGEITPLPELPFQAQKCIDRMKYVLDVNKAKLADSYYVNLEDKDNWENPIWGINGDREEKIYDESRDANLTLQYFDSDDGNCYTVFGSISGQGHECRHHTCEQAWKFFTT